MQRCVALTIFCIHISAGFFHACGVTAGGEAYCWGNNDYGQFGDGDTTSRSTRVLVAGDAGFTVVSAGSTHTCGITATGVAYCWGGNNEGQLGDGTTTRRLTPARVVQ